MSDMDQEIRENAGDALNEATANTEGTKKWGEQETNTGGEADPQIDQAAAAQAADAPSTDEQVQGVHEAAQKAQAAFAGTGDVPGAAGIIESDADGSTSGAAAGTSAGSDAPAPESAHNADGESDGLGEVSGGFDAEEAAKHEDKDDSGDGEDKQPGTGAMLAGILASDPSMKWESKIVGAFSDTDSTEDQNK